MVIRVSEVAVAMGRYLLKISSLSVDESIIAS